MDMKKYMGSSFPKVDDVREGPIQAVIDDVVEGKFDKPNLILDDGTTLSLNKTNNKTLTKAFGTDSDGWIGQKIKLMLGEVDFQGKPQEAIIVQPIPAATAKKASPKGGGDMDDDIAF